MSRTTDQRPEQRGPDSPESESGFRRWSRRKHEARVAIQREKNPPDPLPATTPTEPQPERVLTDADMPPLDSLNEDSDFSPFMSPGVSDALRQAALRRLFRSPQMNVLCELEGEFFDAHGYVPLGNIVTHDMRAAIEREMEKAKASAREKLQEAIDSPPEDTVAESAPPERTADAPDATRATTNETNLKGDA